MEIMKRFVWIILFIALFGCKEKKKFNSFSLENIAIDSMVIYYTENKLQDEIDYPTEDSSITKEFRDSIRLLSNFLHGTNMNFFQSNFFSVVLSDSIMVTDTILLNQLKSIFYNRSRDEELLNASDCLPGDRYIIIFYSNGRRIGGIKICFTCGYINFVPLELNDDFEVTINSFEELKSYFNKNIHSIIH